MAYQFVQANSQSLDCDLSADAGVSNTPLTVAAWFYVTTIPNFSPSAFPIVDMQIAGTTVQGHRLLVGATTSVLRFASVGPTVVQVNGATVLTPNSWHHGVGVIEASNSRLVYLDGTQDGASASDVTIPTTTKLYVGTQKAPGGGFAAYHDGLIAEVGIWDVALNAEEIASLAKGMICERVRPQSLKHYIPLVRELLDVRFAGTITNINNATAATHPRVY